MKDSLHALSRPRTAEAAPPHRLPTWLVPAAIVLGFALLFLVLFRDRLLPARKVEVAVIPATMNDTAHTEAGTPGSPAENAPMAFQASGWVEPDPLPVKATALVDGVVRQVHVLEGQPVSRNQALADLIDDDQKLALQAAQEQLAMQRAGLNEHRAILRAAHNALSSAQARTKAAEASLAEAMDRARRMESLPRGTMPEGDVVFAQTRRDAARADLDAAQADTRQAESDIAALESRTDVLQSSVRAAEVAVSIAQLAHDRTKILSPIDGRVLRLTAAPGQKKVLGMDDPDSSTIAILYDPSHLQVRVDVPLADAAGLQIGQSARIRCGLLPDTVFSGVVTRITGEADVQRNTLQAKVRIENPGDQLRPEMLCRVEFLHAAKRSGGITSAPSLATWIPAAALDGNAAWICDPDTRRVNRRTIQPTGETRDGFHRIAEGLKPGEWVVLSPSGLSDGQRVNPLRKQP